MDAYYKKNSIVTTQKFAFFFCFSDFLGIFRVFKKKSKKSAVRTMKPVIRFFEILKIWVLAATLLRGRLRSLCQQLTGVPNHSGFKPHT